MTRPTRGRANPSVAHRDLFAVLDRIVGSESTPPLNDFLELGRELVSARLEFFARRAIQPVDDPTAHTNGLVKIAVQYHLPNYTPDGQSAYLQSVNAQGTIDHITREGLWPHAQDVLRKFSRSVREELASRLDAPENPRAKKLVATKPVRRDAKTEARDKWIYQQCCKGTPHDKIVAELKKMAPNRKWKIISTKQRVQQIGNKYADDNGLERPSPRRNL